MGSISPVSFLALVADCGIQAVRRGPGDGTVCFSGASPGFGNAESSLLETGTVMLKGRERDLSEIKLKKGEPIDRALRRLKKKVDRENTLREVRNKRHYEKPSERRRRKLKVARFSAMLAARYADQ